MNKTICDLCKTKEANKNFKVKENKEFASYDCRYVYQFRDWVRIDICNDCYKKLWEIKNKHDGE